MAEQEKDILIRNIKKGIDSGNINFLLGSGLSKPFLDTLENIEIDLTKAVDLDSNSSTEQTRNEIIRLKKL